MLRYDREPDGYLRGQDLEFAKTVCDLDGKLDILNAVDEEGFIRVTDLLLKRLNGEVLSVQKGKRQVLIRVNLMGQSRIITLNYQLVDGDGNPLTPAEEMLEDTSDDWLTAWTPDFEDEAVEELDQAFFPEKTGTEESGKTEKEECTGEKEHFPEEDAERKPGDGGGTEP